MDDPAPSEMDFSYIDRVAALHQLLPDLLPPPPVLEKKSTTISQGIISKPRDSPAPISLPPAPNFIVAFEEAYRDLLRLPDSTQVSASVAPDTIPPSAKAEGVFLDAPRVRMAFYKPCQPSWPLKPPELDADFDTIRQDSSSPSSPCLLYTSDLPTKA